MSGMVRGHAESEAGSWRRTALTAICCDDGRIRHCRKRARFYGAFAGGGLCLQHALALADEYGIEAFHLGYREELEKALGDFKAAPRP